ncbi:MAG: type IV secretion system DNA-binding domain-containing protein [Patescibacteria group bacterium]
MPTPQLRPGYGDPHEQEEVCIFAQTNYRNQMRRFGIKLDDRRRHMYTIGKTGMGKTTMMENMVLHDIYRGHGVGVVDPHGDFAEKIIDYIPPSRINDIVYFNPADVDFPIGFNILEVKTEGEKHLIASGLMGIFKKIWPDVWSARMEYILNNAILALLDYPGSTLLGINRLLADKKYRKRVVKQLRDPVVKAFWQNEFANYEDRYAKEAVAPIQNKIGQFLSASIIRNMVAQVKSTIDVRELMDSRKIFIMNLSKGRIGEDNSRLLGGMLITKIQLAAMERVDTPEKDRKDFFLYVDEFQNFATQSFANILSEARKYRLSLIMAHQYIEQLDEEVAAAVFGNVGTLVAFRVGGGDAEALTKEFTPTFLEEDVVNLAKYQVFLKLMIDGVASMPFSAMTLPPIGRPTASKEKVIRVSRERYGKPRNTIEDKIMRWSGMDLGEEGGEDGDLDDEGDDDEKEELPRERPILGSQAVPAPRPEPVAPPKPKPEPIRISSPSGNPNAGNAPAVSLKNLPSRDDVIRKERQDTPPRDPGMIPPDERQKKRRRRRKKKNQQQNTQNIPNSLPQISSPSIPAAPLHISSVVSAPPSHIPPQSAPVVRPIAPDQIIRFDE